MTDYQIGDKVVPSDKAGIHSQSKKTYTVVAVTDDWGGGRIVHVMDDNWREFEARPEALDPA